MRTLSQRAAHAVAFCSLTAAAGGVAHADPTVLSINPPSRLFAQGVQNGPITARFLPDQRFDFQASVQLDAGTTLTNYQFAVDGAAVTVAPGASLATGIGSNRVSVTARAYRTSAVGVHTFTVSGTQSDGKTFTASSNFEVVGITQVGRRAKNVIILLGDGMGIAHRTAARMMLNGVFQGKKNSPLNMDTFPVTGIVSTSSLNSIVTDSAPGMACYSSGNKANNNQEGVFPDLQGRATTDPDGSKDFDDPRVEYLGEFMHRKYGKSTGVVTTADVFDATPASFGVHTRNRGAGTGIIDQFLLEAVPNADLRVLMGGGRRWFLPGNTPASGNLAAGSSRGAATDYVLPSDIVSGWGVASGSVDPNANQIDAFKAAGFTYASDKASLDAAGSPTRLLGLFGMGNMNIALDKIAKRRNATVGNLGGKDPVTGNFVVDDYGFPDQPMLDEMASKALTVLNRNPNGFVLLIEGASIDKQAHNMDSDRWMLDAIEFDRAIGVCKQFAEQNPDTLVLITADHECGGVNLIGASTVSNADLQARAASGGGAAQLRDTVVGTYDLAGFPKYVISPDGYPATTDPDRKLLIGYAANADRFEDWLTNPLPLRDSQSLLNYPGKLPNFPAGPLNRDTAGNFLITGQVPGETAVHTASDIVLSAFGRGSILFTGVMDNTDVFFRAAQVLLGGAK